MENHRKLVVDLVKLAVKTCRRDALEDRCLKALSKLESMDVHNDVFLSTNIGKIISDLKFNPHLKPIVRDSVASVLLKWTRQIYKSHLNDQPYSPPIINPTNPNPNKKSQVKPPPRAVNPNLKTLLTTKVVSSNSKLKKKLKLLGSTKPLPNLMMKKQPLPQRNQEQIRDVDDAIRNDRRQHIFEALDMVLRERCPNTSGCDPIGVAMLVEAMLFQNWGISNSHEYRSFLYNLRDPKNPDFRRKILMGELKPEKIVMLTPEDMVSDMRRIQIDSIRNISLNKSCIVGRGG